MVVATTLPRPDRRGSTLRTVTRGCSTRGRFVREVVGTDSDTRYEQHELHRGDVIGD
jgi:hypothetical protein